jgi:hypothetical protein
MAENSDALRAALGFLVLQKNPPSTSLYYGPFIYRLLCQPLFPTETVWNLPGIACTCNHNINSTTKSNHGGSVGDQLLSGVPLY